MKYIYVDVYHNFQSDEKLLKINALSFRINTGEEIIIYLYIVPALRNTFLWFHQFYAGILGRIFVCFIWFNALQILIQYQFWFLKESTSEDYGNKLGVIRKKSLRFTYAVRNIMLNSFSLI